METTISLTDKQKKIMGRVRNIAIVSKNTLDLMEWSNKFNASPEEIDNTIVTTLAVIKAELKAAQNIFEP